MAHSGVPSLAHLLALFRVSGGKHGAKLEANAINHSPCIMASFFFLLFCTHNRITHPIICLVSKYFPLKVIFTILVSVT